MKLTKFCDVSADVALLSWSISVTDVFKRIGRSLLFIVGNLRIKFRSAVLSIVSGNEELHWLEAFPGSFACHQGAH